MSLIFTIGECPRTTWTVQLEGELNDPPVVVLLIRRPDRTEHKSIYGAGGQPYPITRSSTGIYYADLPLILAGRWVRKWIAFDGSGTPLTARETTFEVRKSRLGSPLGT